MLQTNVMPGFRWDTGLDGGAAGPGTLSMIKLQEMDGDNNLRQD